jgi:hypothetical protein
MTTFAIFFCILAIIVGIGLIAWPHRKGYSNAFHWKTFSTAPRNGKVIRLICIEDYEVVWKLDAFYASSHLMEGWICFPSGDSVPDLRVNQTLVWEYLNEGEN